MMKRKLTAIILALCLLLSLLPGTVFAQEDARAYNQFRVTYDMNGGSVYWSRGSSLPEGTEEDFLADVYMSEERYDRLEALLAERA